MLRRTRTGLITKFNLLTISLIVISSLGIASFLIYQNKTSTYAELLRRGVTTAAMVAQANEYAIYIEDRETLQQAIEVLAVDADIAYVALLDKDKRSLVEKAVQPDLQLPATLRYQQVHPDTNVRFQDFVNSADGRPYLALLAPVVSSSEAGTSELLFETGAPLHAPEIIGYVQLGLSQERIRAHIQSFLFSSLVFTAGLVLLGVGIMMFMTRRIVAPIQKLSQVTQDIAKGNFDQQVEITTQDEISDLASAFNQMLEHLRSSRQDRKSVV